MSDTMGRRQVVRHRVLIPAFAGSNPAGPATEYVNRIGITQHNSLANHMRLIDESYTTLREIIFV